MKKFFFSLIIGFFFFVILYISLNSNFRRSILSFSTGLINNYYFLTINQDLQSENGVEKSIKKIVQQIKITDYITTDQKNSFIDNIYLNIYNIEKFVNSENDLLKLSEVIKKLIKKDPTIYDALIWKTKILILENETKEKIYKTINSAVKLSPANSDAYRIALDYSKKIEDNQNFQKFCKEYHQSVLGSKVVKNQINLFSESSLSRFVLQIKSQKEIENYIMESINLNQVNDYVFDFKKPKSFNEFNFLSNFFPGTKIEIFKIELVDAENESYLINKEDLFVTAQNIFFMTNENLQLMIANSSSEEKIKIKLVNLAKDIIKLSATLKFSKADLTNIEGC